MGQQPSPDTASGRKSVTQPLYVVMGDEPPIGLDGAGGVYVDATGIGAIRDDAEWDDVEAELLFRFAGRAWEHQDSWPAEDRARYCRRLRELRLAALARMNPQGRSGRPRTQDGRAVVAQGARGAGVGEQYIVSTMGKAYEISEDTARRAIKASRMSGPQPSLPRVVNESELAALGPFGGDLVAQAGSSVRSRGGTATSLADVLARGNAPWPVDHPNVYDRHRQREEREDRRRRLVEEQ
jgi:hypothetical protein